MMEKVENYVETTPTDIEKKYVYEIYEKIAPHFSSTRYKPWPKIEEFLNVLLIINHRNWNMGPLLLTWVVGMENIWVSIAKTFRWLEQIEVKI
jgi:hypothetical protein